MQDSCTFAALAACKTLGKASGRVLHIEYGDGTEATVQQMSKDVTTFLMWTAEPHLETRHQMGFKAIIYLIILTVLVYFSMKRIWSRVESEV